VVEVRLVDVKKYFGRVKAVDGINLHIRDGEFLVLLGPSGCGKTTTLRCIAGLERVDQGRIYFDEEDVTDLPPRARNISMVFQSYAVWPHMTVYENIAFPLKIKKTPSHEIERRVKAAAELLGIENLLERYPHQLSGGQRQRVAVARAIVVEPNVLLMDEPLSNLDALLRVRMRSEIKKLQKRIGVTTIYVTHDQVEAMTMADRIAVMNMGRIVQLGTPSEIYHKPQNMFVAGFIGSPQMNFLDAIIETSEEKILLKTKSFEVPLPSTYIKVLKEYMGKEIVLGIRPDDIYIKGYTSIPSRGRAYEVPGTVDFVEALGSDTIVHVDVGRDILIVKVPGEIAVRIGEKVKLLLDLNRLHLFDKRSERAII